MVAQRPSAAFDPIPPDLDLASLVEETPNFEYVTRISCDMISTQGLEAFDKLVLLHVILGGKPLVVEGFQQRLDEWTFTSQWLQDNFGKKCKRVRHTKYHLLTVPYSRKSAQSKQAAGHDALDWSLPQ